MHFPAPQHTTGTVFRWAAFLPIVDHFKAGFCVVNLQFSGPIWNPSRYNADPDMVGAGCFTFGGGPISLHHVVAHVSCPSLTVETWAWWYVVEFWFFCSGFPLFGDCNLVLEHNPAVICSKILARKALAFPLMICLA